MSKHDDLQQLITNHGTVVFLDEPTGELRHGPADNSPTNAFAVVENTRCQLIVRKQGLSFDVTSRPSPIIVTDESEYVAFSNLEIVSYGGGQFALKSKELVLCAEPDGRISLDRTSAGAWGRFTLRPWASNLKTLNICLGHEPFPLAFSDYVDLTIAPFPLNCPGWVEVVRDDYFGVNGHSLSEYAQLLWLYENFDRLTYGYGFVRIFQYRRFVAQKNYGQPSSLPWALRIKPVELANCKPEFDRQCSEELFGAPFQFERGMIQQYADAHILSDLLTFTQFLLEQNILDSNSAVLFLTQPSLIPSCNMGIFRKDTLRWILSTLNQASAFLQSENYTARTGYQRRSLGFLLERLHSYLILMRITAGLSRPVFGHQIIMSETDQISTTTELPQRQ